LINERIFEIGVAVSLEVGKTRMEALGDVAESADLMRYACDAMEANNGFVFSMGKDPLPGYDVTNTHVMKPYGVWLVISPFNFPCALTAGPVGAALVSGNTVVIKPASDTTWSPWLFTQCLLDAGFPDGVVNFVTGPGHTLGKALIENQDLDGATFTGSYDVGMNLYRTFAQGQYIRPLVMELGGKNPVIVSRNADPETAAVGIVRSAFGLQGQKCSACSRVYVEEPLYHDLVKHLVELTDRLAVGDPTIRENYMGPVINQKAYQDYQRYIVELQQAGASILTGGKVLKDNSLSDGYFCAPTLVENVDRDHRLWKHEMFLPISMIEPVGDLEQAMQLANDVPYGLTAGFFGSEEEAVWFWDEIQTGVTYVNRPQGATTGAWPGFQPFGGWKSSGASGKQAGGGNYLQLYMREQSQTIVRKV
jgi:1-pyrroline-5-carboxylate dehydrogenase